MPAKAIKDTAFFKGSVSGDRMMADRKYQERICIKSTAKHVFTTNNLPQVSDLSERILSKNSYYSI